MKKMYQTPQTTIVLSLSDVPLMWDLAGSGSHGEASSAPERFSGTKKPINVMYI